MKSLKLVSVVFILAAVCHTTNAQVIYDWTGDIEIPDVGIRQATAVLTLSCDYTPGELHLDSHFVSFEYSSPNGSYTVPGVTTFDTFSSGTFPGPLPAVAGPGAGTIFIDFPSNATLFATYSHGGWDSELNPLDDTGTNSHWTLRQTCDVPEPSTYIMWGLMGLIGTGLYWKRRKK